MIIQNASSLFIGNTRYALQLNIYVSFCKLDPYSDTSRHYCKVFSSLWPFWIDYSIRMIGGGACQKKFNLLHPCFQNKNSTGTKCYPLNVTMTDSLRTYDFLMISIIDTLVSTLSNAPLACLCSSRNPPEQRVTKPKF